MSSSDRLWRLAAVVSRFRDVGEDQTLAAFATADGGAAHLIYGDLTELLRDVTGCGVRLGRISSWHARETGPAGMVGDYCTECGHVWPCDTRRMADGTYDDGRRAG